VSGNHLVQSVTRALDILESAARSEDGVTLQELSRVLDLKPPTVHNLARTLTVRRLLEKVPNPTRYRLGGVVRELADFQMRSGLLRRAPDVLRRLSEELGGANVVLAQSFNGEVFRVVIIRSERPGMIERPRGDLMHPYTTASAMLFQACWSQEELGAYRRRHPFPEYGADVWGSEEKYEALLRRTRRQHYAALHMERLGFFTVAAPVVSPGGQLLAALGASTHAQSGEADRRRQMTRKIVESARRLSLSLAQR
jgi:DNA-binding IclR family transcriptional regulator